MSVLRQLIVLLLLISVNTEAQFYFGRNKVQYHTIDWKILKTQHFDIYYHSGIREVALRGAEFAEQGYEYLSREFLYTPKRRIPIIFYNTAQLFRQTNTTPGLIPDAVGGFFEFMKGRVAIPYTGSLSDLRHVIHHELTHVFMVGKVSAINSHHRFFDGVMPPLWIVEGLAEFYSARWDAQAEMIMRDALLNEQFVGIQNVGSVYGTFAMYKVGHAFLRFVEQKYSRSTVQSLIDNIWMFSDFNELLEFTFGKSVPEIDREWQTYEQRKYFPLLQNNKRVEEAGKPITTRGFYYSPVVVESRKGTKLFCAGNTDGYTSLFIAEKKSVADEWGEVKTLLRGERSEDVENIRLLQRVIDANDSLIVFIAKKGGRDVLHIANHNGEIFQTIENESLLTIESPRFIPNSNQIIFSAVDTIGFSDIYITNTTDGVVRRITNDIFHDHAPFYHNNSIYFASDRNYNNNIEEHNLFCYNIVKDSLYPLTKGNESALEPFAVNSKNEFLFLSDKDSTRSVYAISLSTGEVTPQLRITQPLFQPLLLNDSTIISSVYSNRSFSLYEFPLSKQITTEIITIDTTKAGWELYSPELTVSDSSAVPYEPQYSLDFAQSQLSTDPIFGTRGGGILGISDMLGDDQFFLMLLNTAQTQDEFLQSFNIDMFRVQQGKRLNYGYGAFHYSGSRYDLRESDTRYFERSFGSYGFAQYPFSQFERVEFSFALANSNRELLRGLTERKSLLAGFSLGYVYDNTLWLGTGPIDGMRVKLTLGYTSDIQYRQVNYLSFIGDARYYYRLGTYATVAMRGALYLNEGREPRRFVVGGSWDLRGYNRWSLRGEKVWLSSVELRLPFLDFVALGLPIGTAVFPGFRAAAFFDAGSVWDTQYKETIGSIGFGMRVNLFNAVVLRYDIGKKIENNFTQLQPKWFYQFFFGWDF